MIVSTHHDIGGIGKPVRRAFADVGVAMLLAFAAGALYRATLLHRIYGNDGAMLADWTALPGGGYPQYHNVLYQPAAKLLELLLPRGLITAPDDPLWIAKSLGVVCAAIGVAFSYGCCRRLGIRAWPSVAGSAVLAVTPTIWFFAAAIEVHMQHFAVVSIGAFVTLSVPWRRAVLATVLTAPLFVVFALSHQSALTLGPAWLLLAQLARRRQGVAALRIAPLFFVGCAWFASLVLGHLLVQWCRDRGFAFGAGDLAHTVSQWRRPFCAQVMVDAVLLPLGVFVPIGLVAIVSRAVPGLLRGLAAVMMLPLISSIVWWGVTERGGYLTGSSFVLAALVAAWIAALRPRVAVPLALGLILLQGAFACWQLRAFDAEGFDLEVRVARITEQLGPNRIVLSCNDNAPKLDIWLPDAREENLLKRLSPGADLDAWCAIVQPMIATVVAQGRVVFDVSFDLRSDLPTIAREAMDRLQTYLRETFVVTVLEDPNWPLWIVEPRR